MKKTKEVLFCSVVILGMYGLFGNTAAQNTEVVVNCDTGATLAVEIEGLDFGTLASLTDPDTTVTRTGVWVDTIPGIEGLRITDELGTCGGDAGALWTVMISFSSLDGVNTPENTLINVASSVDSVITDFVDGSSRIRFPARMNQSNLSLVSGQLSPHITANTYNEGTHIPSGSLTMISRIYNANDGATGVYQLTPEVAIKMGAFIPADTYRGTITVSI